MKRRRATLSVVLTLSAVLLAAGCATRTPLSAAELRNHITYLASDELGGRGVGSEGIDKAADYLAAQFREYGLEPGGDTGTYFQEFEIPVNKWSAKRCRLAVEGKGFAARPFVDFVAMPTSASEPFKGPLTFVGYGITNADEDHDDYAGIKVEGKVALVLRYEPNGWAEGKSRRTKHATFKVKAALAMEHGAVALLIVNPENGKKDELTTGGGRTKYDLPMFHISRSMANWLLGAGGLSPLGELQQRINSDHKNASADLSEIVLSGESGYESSSIVAKNVIGILRGAGPLADEYVVFGGHYDHLGNVPPTRRPNLSGNFDPAKAEIHNGADDNASGTAGVTELARVYAADPKPRRSLVFMAFTGEESGLLGSRHFVENPTIPLDKTVMMINMDMIGRNENRPIEVFGTKTAEEFESLVKKHARRAGLSAKLSGGGTGPSDHTHFYRKEIPVLFAFTGLHTDYHKPTDDVDKIDYPGTVRVLEFVRSLADEIIASETGPTYKAGAGSSGPARRGYRVTMGIMPSYGDGGDEPGWAVDGVIPERAAAKAGMKDGDRILTINGKKISGIGDYMDALADNQPGDLVEVEVKRGTKKVTLKVKLEGK